MTSAPSATVAAHLERVRGLRHEDCRPATKKPRGVGHRLAVVSRRGRHDAPRPCIGPERGQKIDAAAHLECTGRVQVLALEDGAAPQCTGEPRRLERRRRRQVGSRSTRRALNTSARVGIGQSMWLRSPESFRHGHTHVWKSGAEPGQSTSRSLRHDETVELRAVGRDLAHGQGRSRRRRQR